MKKLLVVLLVIAGVGCQKKKEESKTSSHISDNEQAIVAVKISAATLEVLEETASQGSSHAASGSDWDLLRKYCGFSVKKGIYSLKKEGDSYILDYEGDKDLNQSFLNGLAFNSKLDPGVEVEVVSGGLIIPYQKSDPDRIEKIESIGKPILYLNSASNELKVTRTCGLWKKE